MSVRQIQLRLFSELRSTAMTSKRKSSMEQFELSSSENKKQRPQQSVQLQLFEDPLPKSRDNCFLHRFGLEDWRPSGVTHFAFLSDEVEILAFIREDGQIEFWDPRTWTCFKIIPGRDNLTPSGLCWTINPPRLYSTSLSGELVEWDLQLDQIKSREQVNGGGIWSLAASPSCQDSSSLLAIACEDGIVRLYQLEENGVGLFGQLQSESPRALSLGWNRNGDSLLVGYSDGTCRLWDILHKNQNSKMNVGFESMRVTLPTNDATGKDVHICTVLCIDEFDEFVCGDSLGGVTIWDKRYGTQLSSFQKHQGAITALTTYTRESMFYLISSRADGGVVFYQRGNDQWEYVHLRRPHVHDVLCMGVFDHGSKHSIVTGSQDSTVRVLSCPMDVDLVKAYLKKKLFTIDLTPERPRFGLAQCQRLLTVTHKKEIEFWKIPCEYNEVTLEDRADGELVSVHDEPQLLTKMKISNEDHIVCGDISSNGDYFAFSSQTHLKVMKLELQQDRLEFHGLDLGKKLSGVCQLVFSKDSKYLFVVDWENNVLVFDLEAKKQCYEMVIPNDPPTSVQEAKIVMRCHPKRIEISPDNIQLCIQFHSSIGVYSIPQDFNTQGLKKVTVFKSEIPITSMRALFDNGILATMSDGRLRRYGLDDLTCKEWNNRHLQGKQFHSIIPTLQERGSVILCSGVMFMHLGLDSPISPSGGSDIGQNPRLVNMDQNHRLLYLEFLSSNSILLVHADWTKVLKKMSPPVYRHRYGT